MSYLLPLLPSSKGIPTGICSEQTNVLPLLDQTVRTQQHLPGGGLSRAGRDSTSLILAPLHYLSLNPEHWLGPTCIGYTPWACTHPIDHEVGGSQRASCNCVITQTVKYRRPVQPASPHPQQVLRLWGLWRARSPGWTQQSTTDHIHPPLSSIHWTLRSS